MPRCCCRTRLQSALTAWRAGIPERWGYRAHGRSRVADARGPLPRPARGAPGRSTISI